MRKVLKLILLLIVLYASKTFSELNFKDFLFQYNLRDEDELSVSSHHCQNYINSTFSKFSQLFQYLLLLLLHTIILYFNKIKRSLTFNLLQSFNRHYFHHWVFFKIFSNYFSIAIIREISNYQSHPFLRLQVSFIISKLNLYK